MALRQRSQLPSQRQCDENPERHLRSALLNAKPCIGLSQQCMDGPRSLPQPLANVWLRNRGTDAERTRRLGFGQAKLLNQQRNALSKFR